MLFWDWVAIIIIVGIVTQGVVSIVKYGVRYSENIERMKRGYPLKDGTPSVNKNAVAEQGDSLSQALAGTNHN